MIPNLESELNSNDIVKVMELKSESLHVKAAELESKLVCVGLFYFIPQTHTCTHMHTCYFHRAPWLRGRASDSRLREPVFGSCAAVLKPWASVFTLHCSSSLSCINEYLAIDSGGYVYEQPSRINCSIWLDASQRSRDGV